MNNRDIALKGDKIIKTHDLTLLNKICTKFDKDFQSIEEDCIELVDYGVHVRYPFYIDLEKKIWKKQ